MPFVPVRDTQMYYEIRGKGPRLLSISFKDVPLIWWKCEESES
jgi:hypothetical protein